MFMCNVTNHYLLSRILFTANYCYFAHGDFSTNFIGTNDNDMLEFSFAHTCISLTSYL